MYKNPLSNKYLGIMCRSKYCPSNDTAHSIQKILHADWNSFVETFEEAGCGPLIPGANYWYDETSWTLISNTTVSSAITVDLPTERKTAAESIISSTKSMEGTIARSVKEQVCKVTTQRIFFF